MHTYGPEDGMDARPEARRDGRAGNRDRQDAVPADDDPTAGGAGQRAQEGGDGVGLGLQGVDLALELGLAVPHLVEEAVLVGRLRGGLLADRRLLVARRADRGP